MATRPASKLNLQEFGLQDEVEIVDKQARQSIENIIDDTTTSDDSTYSSSKIETELSSIEDEIDAIIDDTTTASTSTWSSNKITEEIEDKSSVTKTATGNPVELSDSASAPMVKCVSDITGSQDLHGYDKPWVGGSGKNKLPMTVSGIKSANTSGTWSGNAYTLNGVTFTIETDGDDNVTGIKVNGTASSNASFILARPYYPPDGFLSGCPSGGDWSGTYGLGIQILASPYTVCSDSGNGVKLTSEHIGNQCQALIMIRANYNANLVFHPQVEIGSSATSYEPYSNICPITAYTEGEIEVGGKNEYVTTNTTAQSHSAAVDIVNATSIRVYRNGTGTYPASKQLLSNYNFIEGKTYKVKAYANVVSGIAEIAIRDSSNNPVSASSQISTSGNLEMNFTYNPNTMSYLSFFATYNQSTGGDVTYERIAIYDIDVVPTTHTTTYPSAIYRGSEDVVKGEVTITHKKYTPTSWTRNSDHEFYTYFASSEISTGTRRPCISDKFRAWDGTEPTSTYGICFINSDGALRINTVDAYSSASDMMTAIGDISFVCDLATPSEEDVTPTNAPIKSLSGYTHIESSTGDMEIEYITEEFQPLVDLIQSAVELPEVSDLDDGKVLTVVNGKWVAASLPVGQNIQY